MAETDQDQLTPKDMRIWLQSEVRRVMKAAELQVKDATDFVTAYTAGELSAEETSERMTIYNSRWNEHPLIAAMPRDGMTNEEILKNLDQQRDGEEHSWVERHSSKSPIRGL